MAKRYHLYIWEPEMDKVVNGKSCGGEMRHFQFNEKHDLVEYLKQFSRELSTMPAVAKEFGLTKTSKMGIREYLENGYIFINHGEDMDLSVNKDSIIEDVFVAD